ncbi:hypothetical protein D3C72_2190580 [compost metagenome]
MEPLQCLNTRHFIERDDMNPERLQERSHPIQSADRLCLFGEDNRILRFGIQPAFAAMRA